MPTAKKQLNRKELRSWLAQLDQQLDLEALMKGCCGMLIKLTGADRCSIMVLDSDTDHLIVRWAHGNRVQMKGSGMKFRVGEGLCGWVARSQKSFCSLDATKEVRFMPRAQQSGQPRNFKEVRGICCTPLVVDGRTVGVINFSSFDAKKTRFDWIRKDEVKLFIERLARVIYQAALLRESQAVSERFRRQAKATSETVAQVSHEVRTPLTLVTEASQQLIDELAGPLQPDQKKLVHIIQSQSQRMLKLVSELLDISRIEAGRMALYREPMSMADAIRDVADRYQMLVSPRKLILEIGLVPLVYGDKTRLAQIVENLLGNAVKFTPPEGSITIGLREKGKTAEISVQDTGAGIPHKQLKLLFQRFSKLKVAAGINVRGTGLGLMIVKEVAQMHGGAVRVDSEPGKGTRFSVTLPLYSSTLALSEEFRVMREQSSREGRDLAIQLLRLKKDPKATLNEIREMLVKHVSREDRILENPDGGLVILSVVDPEGFAAMRKRIDQVFAANLPAVNSRDLGWGWALVPKEGTTLTMVLPIAERRAQEEKLEAAKSR